MLMESSLVSSLLASLMVGVGMECGSFLDDEVWASSSIRQFFEDIEEVDFIDDTFDLKSEEASSSSNEYSLPSIDSSELLEPHLCHRSDSNSNSNSNVAEVHARPASASCLGKRDRDKAATAAKESKWALQLLNSCAEAAASNNLQRTQHLMWVLNDLACLNGDANQRLSAYGLKALFARITGATFNSDFAALCSETTFHKALLKFHDVNPWHQMVYAVTNGVLVNFFEGKDKLHVIDIGTAQGTQWPTLIEALATRPSGSPKLLKLTIVEDPSSVHSAEVKCRLEKFAAIMGLNMELRVVSSMLGALNRDILQITADESLAVCAQFSLSKLDASPGAMEGSSRDSFLRYLHTELKPELLILGENDSEQTSPDFGTAFNEVICHFWSFLDSMNAAFKGRDSKERQMIEQLFFSAMFNSVAAEVQRYESQASWSKRLTDAGFVAACVHEEIVETVRMLVKKHDSNWELRNSENRLSLLWKLQPATFCSVWTSF